MLAFIVLIILNYTNSKKLVSIKKDRMMPRFLKEPPSSINVKCPSCVWYKDFKVKNDYIQNYGYCKKFNALSIYAIEHDTLCGKQFKHYTSSANKFENWYLLLQECSIF